MRQSLRIATLTLGLAAGFGGLGGCHDSSKDEATKDAQKALGVRDAKETTSNEKQEVLEVVEKKFVDKDTGEPIGTTEKKVTPVTIETKVNKEVKVKAGETQVSPPAKK